MPRFFFNLIEDAVIADDEGRDLPGVEAAHSEAVKSARDIACAELAEGQLHLNHRIEVTDAFGELLDTVRLGDVVEVLDD